MFVKATPEEVTVAVNVTVSTEVDGFKEEMSAVAVFDLLTTCPPGKVPLLLLNLALPLAVPSPTKSTVIVCVPAVRLLMTALLAQELWAAQPDVPSTTVPNDVPVPEGPSQNCTEPVGGTTVVEEVTVAVNVTLWLTKDGFCDDTTAVVVFDFWTSCDREAVLELNAVSPRKSAVIVCAPNAKLETTGLSAQALLTGQLPPVVSVTGEPMVVPPPDGPSRNCTVPVGGTTVLKEVTVAVNVTPWVTLDGFSEDVIAVEVSDLLTVCVNGVPVLSLGSKLPSPL